MARAIRDLVAFGRLSPTRRGLLSRAAFWIVVMRARLLWASPGRLILPPVDSGMPAASPADAAWAVRAISNRLPGTTCLARALALHALLRDGHESRVRFGVAPAAGAGIEAHAWVECDGIVLDDPATAARHSPFEPARRAA